MPSRDPRRSLRSRDVLAVLDSSYDLAARKVAWKTHLGVDVDASCLILGDRIYVGVEEGKPTFHCLDRTTGKDIWTRNIPEGVWSSAAVSGKNVIVGGNDGIGHLILSGQFNIDTPLVFAALVSITAFTTLGIGAISLFENAVLKWRPSQRRR